MKKIIIALFVFFATYANSQALNSYKFLIVPSKFEFQKTEDQYGLSSIMEAYFKQQGFTVVQSNNVSKDMNSNRCQNIYANIIRQNSMFSTKIRVVLTDCEGKQLLISTEGVSKAKEFDVAHNESLRIALKSIPNQNYVFDQNTAQKTMVIEKTLEANLPETSNNLTIDVIQNNNVLTVETLSNGYLLIEPSSSKVILKLYNTSNKDVFIATSQTKNGIVTRFSDKVIFEYIKENILYVETLNVRL